MTVMCGTGGTNDHGPAFVWFTAAAFKMRGAGSAQKGLSSHYISDFNRIKRVHIKRSSLEFKNTRNSKSKRKKVSRSARPYVHPYFSAEQSCFCLRM